MVVLPFWFNFDCYQRIFIMEEAFSSDRAIYWLRRDQTLKNFIIESFVIYGTFPVALNMSAFEMVNT